MCCCLPKLIAIAEAEPCEKFRLSQGTGVCVKLEIRFAAENDGQRRRNRCRRLSSPETIGYCKKELLRAEVYGYRRIFKSSKLEITSDTSSYWNQSALPLSVRNSIRRGRIDCQFTFLAVIAIHWTGYSCSFQRGSLEFLFRRFRISNRTPLRPLRLMRHARSQATADLHCTSSLLFWF